MYFIHRKILSTTEKQQVLALWNSAYPEKLTYSNLAAFEEYLEKLGDPSHTLCLDEQQKIQAWYVDFEREGKQWFAIIVSEAYQGKGIGKQLLQRAKQQAQELNGWVIDHHRDKKRDGSEYASPLAFYLKNGFKLLPENRLELDKISAVQIRWRK